jgi:hypothetical protein
MTTETILVKRRAAYKGEVGLFADNEMSESDLALATMDEEVLCKWYSPRNLQAMRFLWGLVWKTWQNTDIWLDHHKAMEDFKARIHFTKMLWNPQAKKTKPAIRSLTRINNEELRLVTERIMDVICQEIIPGIEKDDLRREVEEMLDGKKVRT